VSRIDFVTGAPEKYAHLVDALAKVPEELWRVTSGQPTSALRTARGEEWSAQRVLAHMASYAGWQDRFIKQVATMTDPAPPAFDQTAAAEALAAEDPVALLQRVEQEVGATVEFLSGTPDASWGRPGRVRSGRRSLRQIVERHIAHMNEHVEQVKASLGAS
jgi:hypothetical protein